MERNRDKDIRGIGWEDTILFGYHLFIGPFF
jgi:hypothetical protein